MVWKFGRSAHSISPPLLSSLLFSSLPSSLVTIDADQLNITTAVWLSPAKNPTTGKQVRIQARHSHLGLIFLLLFHFSFILTLKYVVNLFFYGKSKINRVSSNGAVETLVLNIRDIRSG